VSNNRNQQSTANTRQAGTTNNSQQQGHMTINSQHSTKTPSNQQQTTITDRYIQKPKRTRQQARVKTNIFTENHNLSVVAKIILLQFSSLWHKVEADLSPGFGLPPFIQSHSSLCIATRISECH
jgi:hypothetical protein